MGLDCERQDGDANISVSGANGSYLLIAVPCMLMMGAMVWMMMGGMGGSSRGGDK